MANDEMESRVGFHKFEPEQLTPLQKICCDLEADLQNYATENVKLQERIEELEKEVSNLRNQRDHLQTLLNSAELYIKELKNEVDSEDDDLRRVCGKRVDNLDRLIEKIRRA